MSWEHGTFGWNQYEYFVGRLMERRIPFDRQLKEEAYIREREDEHFCQCAIADESCTHCEGTCDCFQQLRMAEFKDPVSGKVMVVEEFLQLKDRDCDGASMVNITVYEKGHRPNLVTAEIPA